MPAIIVPMIWADGALFRQQCRCQVKTLLSGYGQHTGINKQKTLLCKALDDIYSVTAIVLIQSDMLKILVRFLNEDFSVNGCA